MTTTSLTGLGEVSMTTTTKAHRADEHAAEAGPEKPTQLEASSWWGVLRRTAREFRDDHLTDWAAALTYYSAMSLFPALLVLVALVGLLGQYPETTDAILK